MFQNPSFSIGNMFFCFKTPIKHLTKKHLEYHRFILINHLIISSFVWSSPSKIISRYYYIKWAITITVSYHLVNLKRDQKHDRFPPNRARWLYHRFGQITSSSSNKWPPHWFLNFKKNCRRQEPPPDHVEVIGGLESACWREESIGRRLYKNLGLYKVFFLLSIMVNLHETTIWGIWSIFSKHQTSK